MDYLGTILTLATKVMDQIPNYDQRKKEKFYKLKRKYEEERIRPRDMQDMGALLTYKKELEMYVETFIKEIES